MQVSNRDAVLFLETIDRRIVHRRSVAEVFVTSVVAAGERHWMCAVQLSRSHRRMPSRGGPLPAILVLEASRQAGLAIAHSAFDVALDCDFLLDQASMRWVGHRPHIGLGEPLEATLHVHIIDVRYHHGRLRSLTFEGTWMVDGRVTVAARARMRCVSATAARALRTRRPRPIHASVFVRGGTARSFEERSGYERVQWDAADPMLFDHEVDHVPGMVLADAAITLAADDFQALSLRFVRFVDLERPLFVRGTHRGAALDVSFMQSDQVVANGEIERAHQLQAEPIVLRQN